MGRLSNINYKKFVRLLRKRGYFLARQKGSHAIFDNEKGYTITVPRHPGKNLGKGLLRKLIRDLDMTVDEFSREVKR